MMRSGNGTDTCSTTSTGSPARMPSVRSTSRPLATGTSAFISDGLKAGWTCLRYAVCSGGSVCIIVGGLSYSTPISRVRIPFFDEKRVGSVDTSWHSA